ncbi:aldehyde ferredoxin oxidoreductase [candidate division KSB3 bacterium]|uniref:Aldehyde ferredoxin oxidoreductase n=1 Tax=candidate division KSB3 bacterium TaxID=2044937 RepID=A0A9D5JY46_9BACT|nr:aldehyde ferredoxin oxidoreductase [candidate division KSB3 bacterium]MBD3326314.1 aldehyde ferredoxin oxidoreductase [candidate division KSB3 bacterium]
MSRAFWGQLLEVDLTNSHFTYSPFPEYIANHVLGGRGFNVWYLHTHLPPRIDPLAPDNIVIFSCGLLTGTAIPTASRLHVNALSPLTGIIGSSNVGGEIGHRLRSCQIQSLAIRGKAEHPIYLYIGPDGVEFRDARDLWGLDTEQTQQRLAEVYDGEQVKSLTIGPAGEHGVPFACIITDRDHAAGRTGMGAVMGSKLLKAIVIAQGVQRPVSTTSVVAKQALSRYLRRIRASADYPIFAQYGGAGYVKWADDMGLLSTRNYRQKRFEGSDQIDGKRLKTHRVRSTGCKRCPVQCKAILHFRNGKFNGRPANRPEFEPMVNLGAKCGLQDLETVVFLDNLCTHLGLDSISTGTAIAFAMDLYERGLLSPEQTGNLDLTWGNGEVMETLIRQMASGEGLGAILAQGVRRAAECLGNGAEQYAPHVKGLELTGYHPQTSLGTALGFAISSRGGDYSNVYTPMLHDWPPDNVLKAFGTLEAVDMRSPAGKGRLVKWAVLINIVLDSLGLCKVPTLSLARTFDLENEAILTADLTGWPVTAASLFEAGGRIANLERRFNLQRGMKLMDEGLPEMFLHSENGTALRPESLVQMLQEFYAAMGWDEHGCPPEDDLEA